MLKNALWIGLFFLILVAWPTTARCGEKDNNLLTLGKVIRKACEEDASIQALRWKQKAGEARIREIAHRNGWEVFLEGEQRFQRGNREEHRDDSLERNEMDVDDDLSEDEWQIQAGFQKRFWGASRDREADIAVERLDQLDRLTDIAKARQDRAFEAAEAYLKVYEGNLLSSLIAEQISYASEVLRIFETMAEQGEAIDLSVLEARLDLNQLRQRLKQLEFSSTRHLAYLRDVLNRPNLTPSALAAPEVPGSTTIQEHTQERLIAHALEQQAAFQVAEVALEFADRFARHHAGVYPDIDLELGVGCNNLSRDYSDEARQDDLYEIKFAAGITVPLGLGSRNQARRERFQSEAESRACKLKAQHSKTRDSVMNAYSDYQMALWECQIQQQRLEREREQLRVLNLSAEQMPELVGENVNLKVYKARSDLLEVRSDVQRAEHDRLTALLRLSAESGYLLNDRELIEEIRRAHP